VADRNAGVWRPSIVPRSGPFRPPASRDATVAVRRRAVRLARVGRLSAAARALRADPPAPQTPADHREARGLLPPAAPDMATPAWIEAGFSADLARGGAHALAGADHLLLAKLGGVCEDGLPGLRPIAMPEALRKLAASALAPTVRSSAADLLSPGQLGVGFPNACECILHELGAHLAHHPGDTVLQLDFKNAFNLVSRPAAEAVMHRALPVLTFYLR